MEMDQQQEPEEGSPIFLVPDVILEEKIFAFSGNLKNLMLTCKYFNDLISNSRILMKRLELKIKKVNVFAIPILKSNRKYSCIEFCNIECLSPHYKRIFQRFHNSITEISLNACYLDSIILADTFSTLVHLEKLVTSRTRFFGTVRCNVDFSKFSRLKRVHIAHSDISLLNCLPETEELNIEMLKPDSGNHLKRYLETSSQLKTLKISCRSAAFSQFRILPAKINFKLINFEITSFSHPRVEFSSELINFVKIQAKTLKRLGIGKFLMDLNTTLNLLEPMEALECLEITNVDFHSLTPFVAESFTCKKLRNLKLKNVRDFPLFNEFPNLEELEIIDVNQMDSILEAAQNHQKIKKLALSSINDRLSDAFFPNLVDLKLESVNAVGGLNEARKLRKVLENLSNLKHLNIRLWKNYSSGKGKKDIQRKFDADNQILMNIWPLLVNLKTLTIRGGNLNKNIIYQEFPMIPGLRVIIE